MQRTFLTLQLAACATAPTGSESVTEGSPAHDVSLTVDERIHTVVHVAWTTEVPTTGWVDFGEGVGDHQVQAKELATEHHVSLFGLPPDADIEARITTATGEGAESVGDIETVHTDPWGPELPSLTLSGEVVSWKGEYVAFNTVVDPWALILDDQGRVVWAFEPEVPEGSLLMRVLLTRDGTAMLAVIAAHDGEHDAENHVIRINLDGSGESILEWPYLDHDVAELPDGTLAGIVKEQRDGLWGDNIEERRPDGERLTIYSTWGDAAVPQDTKAAQDGELTHANALDYDEPSDSYYINLAIPEFFTRVDHATGRPIWHAYGKSTEFSHPADDPPLLFSHQFEVLGDGNFLHFQNGEPGKESSVREIHLDEAEGTMHSVWKYESDPPLAVAVKGDVHRFADGGTSILWGSAGQLQDLTASGETAWLVELDLGEVFTYFQHVSRLGP